MISHNKRTLRDGTSVQELQKAVKLEVYTRCPQKWKLVDMETGEEYIGHEDPTAGPSHWKKIDNA